MKVMKVIKVIEIISDTNIGGAGVLLLNRLKYTDKQKYSTLVLIPRGSMLAPRLEKMGVEYREISGNADRSMDVRTVREYVSVFKEIKPDIINAHGCLSARIAAYLCGVPVKICTRHCVFPVGKTSKVRKKISGAFNSALSDKFIAVAYAAKENLIELGVDEDKIEVVINGAVALKRFTEDDKAQTRERLGISKESTVLGMCARLEKYKGHEWFFEVFRILLDSGVDVYAVFIGDGSQREYLVGLCRQYEIEKRVRFIGFVSDVSPYMNIVDINVNCSVGTETSSLALSEGMSLGIPSVVSSFGGNPYMVDHGVNGLVCVCYDSQKMAEYICDLINDRELYRRMSLAARKRFEDELNARAMTEKTNKLYDRLYEAYHRA